MLRFGIFLCCFFVITTACGQAPAFKGWLVFNHEQKLAGKWSILSDIQLRSAAKVNHLENILIRPAVQYKFNDRNSVALGYALFLTFQREEGRTGFEREHRIWQQYIFKLKPGSVEWTNRLRLEQRFLESGSNDHDLAHRFRYYFRLMKPLKRSVEFIRGWYIAGQNELFLNIAHKEYANDRYIDQNRLYAGPGFRFSEGFDLEAGYMFRYQPGEGRIRDHILQVTVSTKL